MVAVVAVMSVALKNRWAGGKNKAVTPIWKSAEIERAMR